MAKVNRTKEICGAITEIRKILASSSVQAGLLRKSLEQQEKDLLNDLYEEVKKKIRQTKRAKVVVKKPENSNNPTKGGSDENR